MTQSPPPTPIIITGPTASGKSQAAIELALKVGGEIINADSMQLYDHLPILTACPSAEDHAIVPHHLYGILRDDQISSAGWWVQIVEKIISQIQGRGAIPIIVGGTGMYLQALTEGLSPIPDIPQNIRETARQKSQEEDFFTHVCSLDPQVSKNLKAGDLQRLTRALEVILFTGKSLFEWQKESRIPSPYVYEKYVILPDRKELYDRINNRFNQMIERGAIDEVEALMNRPVLPASPILRAVGVEEITYYLQGHFSKDQMIKLGQQSSRHYAKRQLTWLRTQSKGYIPLTGDFANL